MAIMYSPLSISWLYILNFLQEGDGWEGGWGLQRRGSSFLAHSSYKHVSPLNMYKIPSSRNNLTNKTCWWSGWPFTVMFRILDGYQDCVFWWPAAEEKIIISVLACSQILTCAMGACRFMSTPPCLKVAKCQILTQSKYWKPTLIPYFQLLATSF